VDFTGDNILYDTTALAAANLFPNHPARITPASAKWSNLVASGSTDSAFNSNFRMQALRINITAGTGSVAFTINQNPGGGG
jgi:hypothetical protein